MSDYSNLSSEEKVPKLEAELAAKNEELRVHGRKSCIWTMIYVGVAAAIPWMHSTGKYIQSALKQQKEYAQAFEEQREFFSQASDRQREFFNRASDEQREKFREALNRKDTEIAILSSRVAVLQMRKNREYEEERKWILGSNELLRARVDRYRGELEDTRRAYENIAAVCSEYDRRNAELIDHVRELERELQTRPEQH